MSQKSFSHKRKFCDHCGDYVSARTYRQHIQLYYNIKTGRWEDNNESSDEECFPRATEHINNNLTRSDDTLQESYSELPFENEGTQQDQGIIFIVLKTLRVNNIFLFFQITVKHGFKNTYIYHD